ncbi:Protein STRICTOSIDINE SYNTHASE-LIKE 3 [Camellia lanceoleosa]|uniref:Protein STRICTOSIDINE SYNTHASE-LIKE 3 n=1 Tax=Camellia lanceoleosa TaxID=1840588 RepID=A0ACC0HCE6_9ERIC|nr:Protein STRICTOSIDINE SYNTHASE-LIKE 3 [Camellia lanceoleosa]
MKAILGCQRENRRDAVVAAIDAFVTALQERQNDVRLGERESMREQERQERRGLMGFIQEDESFLCTFCNYKYGICHACNGSAAHLQITCHIAGLKGFMACRALSQRNSNPSKALRPWDINTSRRARSSKSSLISVSGDYPSSSPIAGLFLLLALYCGIDPFKHNAISDFPDFETYKVEMPDWSDVPAVKDSENLLQKSEIILNQIQGSESMAFDPQGRGPYKRFIGFVFAHLGLIQKPQKMDIY